MNEKIYNRITKVLEDTDDIDNLTAQKLAELAFTSPSTISRYVKLQGHRNFIEYKIAVKSEKDNLNKEYTMQIFESWNERLTTSFKSLEMSIVSSVNLLKSNRIYVWCKREYDSIAKEFTFLLSRAGYTAINIDDYFLVDDLIADEDVILTIGQIPPDLYRKNLKYVSIVYTNFIDKTESNNITTLKVMPLKYQKYDTLNINYRVTCIQLLLGIICEQLCLAAHHSEEK